MNVLSGASQLGTVETPNCSAANYSDFHVTKSTPILAATRRDEEAGQMSRIVVDTSNKKGTLNSSECLQKDVRTT